jgi:hypothetical protein
MSIYLTLEENGIELADAGSITCTNPADSASVKLLFTEAATLFRQLEEHQRGRSPNKLDIRVMERVVAVKAILEQPVSPDPEANSSIILMLGLLLRELDGRNTTPSLMISAVRIARRIRLPFYDI